jgi:hypothetical protein
MSQEETINLIAEGDVKIPFPRKYIKYSILISTMNQDDSAVGDTPLTSISASQINKFIEFCAAMEESPIPNIVSGNLPAQFAAINPRYTALLNSLLQPVAGSAAAGGGGGGGGGASRGDLLADMIQTCNFVDCKPLLKLLCGFFCLHFLNGKSADQVRSEWGIVNDFTPAEQAAIAAEEAWLNQ